MTVPDALKYIDFVEKDSKRFQDATYGGLTMRSDGSHPTVTAPVGVPEPALAW
jgi:hypothetical protein